MTSIAETLGFILPGGASIPAPDAGRYPPGDADRSAHRRDGLGRPEAQRLPSRSSFANAIAAAMAMGCSTNAIVHVVAMGRRAGFDIMLDDFDRIGREVPVIANIRPNGDTYLMEDFFYAGGLRAMLKRIEAHLDGDAKTVNGKSIGANIAKAKVYNDDIIRTVDNLYESGALVVLKETWPRRLRDEGFCHGQPVSQAHRPGASLRRLSQHESCR